MEAEVLRQEYLNTDTDSAVEGSWETHQDPISGAFLREWVPGSPAKNDEPESVLKTISCLVRGVVDGGIRVAGTTERFGDTYSNIEYVKMWTPPNVFVTKRDRITNIRSKRGGVVVWKDDEYDDKPTVFNVNGVTPLFDAFNRHVENYIQLEKA
jgi:hypothetical protein